MDRNNPKCRSLQGAHRRINGLQIGLQHGDRQLPDKVRLHTVSVLSFAVWDLSFAGTVLQSTLLTTTLEPAATHAPLPLHAVVVDAPTPFDCRAAIAMRCWCGAVVQSGLVGFSTLFCYEDDEARTSDG